MSVLAAIVLVGATACTPPSPPELEIGCYNLGVGSVYYQGPIDTLDNATPYAEFACNGSPGPFTTIVSGGTRAEARAKCDQLGFAGIDPAFIELPDQSFACSDSGVPDFAPGCYQDAALAVSIEYAGPVNTVKNALAGPGVGDNCAGVGLSELNIVYGVHGLDALLECEEILGPDPVSIDEIYPDFGGQIPSGFYLCAPGAPF